MGRIEFYDGKETTKKSNARVASFIKKYNALNAQIAKRFGKSERTGDVLNIASVKKGMTREDCWKPDGHTEIQLSTTLSGQYERNAQYTITPTYRIRLYIKRV